jgi:hypothetical protein
MLNGNLRKGRTGRPRATDADRYPGGQIRHAIACADQTPDTTDTNKKGAWAELIACAWLIQNGWEVFRNVTPTGARDLVARRHGKYIGIDVKLIRTLGRGPSLKPEQLADGVWPLFVLPDGSCGFGGGFSDKCGKEIWSDEFYSGSLHARELGAPIGRFT